MLKIKPLLILALSVLILLLTAGSCGGGVPDILGFSADPETITTGESSELSWSVRGATSVSINQDVGDVTNQTSISVSPTATTTYTLTATNSVGSVTRSVTVTVEESGEQELIRNIREVLPDMEEFRLVRIDDAPIVATLEAAIGTPGPVYVELPIVRPDNTLEMHTWTAYHVNVRAPEFIAEFDDEALEAVPPMISGPSRTFQGLPNWNDNEFFGELTRLQRLQPQLDESLYQASVLNLIGNHLEGAYYGNPERAYASVLEHVGNLLEPHVGIAEAARLAGLSENNYIVYNHENYQPEVVHNENEATLPEDVIGIDGDNHVHAAGTLEPQNHVNVRFLRPVMVADATIFNPDTGTWLVNNWHARMDAAANRQNAYLWLAHIGPQPLPPAYGNTPDNNRLIIRTQIGGYLVLTPFGKTLLNPANSSHYPSNSCGGAGSFIDNVRKISNDSRNHPNEYWMWWTRHYGGGCAYIATLGRTPRNGAVGWSGWGNATVDWTSFVFMHESGHILGGLHSIDNTGNTGETWNNHRCRLLGIWPFGPTGPSVMSYAGGTRTYCYATTNPNDPTPAFRVKKNVTYMADFLHPRLQ